MWGEKGSLHRHSARCAVAALIMLLLGCGIRANVESIGAAGIQHRQEAAQSMSLDEAKRLSQEVVSLYSAGRYDEARPLAERAPGIYENVLGSEHPDVAQSLTNLAELYRAQGDYTKAEPLHQRAWGYEKVLSPEHPDVANSLNNLAVLYRVQGDYTKAEPLHQRALVHNQATFLGMTRCASPYSHNRHRPALRVPRHSAGDLVPRRPACHGPISVQSG